MACHVEGWTDYELNEDKLFLTSAKCEPHWKWWCFGGVSPNDLRLVKYSNLQSDGSMSIMMVYVKLPDGIMVMSHLDVI